MIQLEQYFEQFRRNVIGYNKTIQTPYGEKPLVYADWVASGRFYEPIEHTITHTLGPLIGNTHTETNITGTSMTLAYEEAKQIIKRHVKADLEQDVLILTGSGMTGAINKFIRILGWKIHERYRDSIYIPLKERP
ncbi:MAG: selenocysteine lyase, partial [Bacteroidota bacterium]